MTKQLRTQIDIQASPERVWQVLTDFGAYSQWNPFMVQASGRAAQGERITIRMRPEGGRAMTFRPTVREAAARRRRSWLGHLVLPGRFGGEHSLTTEPLGEGRVRLPPPQECRCVLAPLLATSLGRRTLPAFDHLNPALKRRAAQPE